MSIRRNAGGQIDKRDNALIVTMVLGYLYNCINPFIYATKFDPVKRVLLRMIPCMKTAPEPVESVGMT